MKSSINKIRKLLDRTESISSQCFDGVQKQGKKSAIKREKNAVRALDFAYKALALCREETANGASDCALEFIYSIHRISAILFRLGREEEAEPLLAEIYESKDLYSGRGTVLSPCLAYYGSILCNSGRYDLAAEVLDAFMKRFKMETAVRETVEDTYASCLGFGCAARAFTYADAGEGYDSEHFTYPAEALAGIVKNLKAKGQNPEIAIQNYRRAAYFAASQQLFMTCWDTVPGADVGQAVIYAHECVKASKELGVKDLYYLGAHRLGALAMARDCRFSDSAEICSEALDECSGYKGEETQTDYTSLQSISGDLNLLMGIMNYRASNISDCVRYFEAAIAAFEADAKGRPLRETGYVEAETELIFMSNAEKCAFACKYVGLAKFSESERYSLDECVRMMRRGAELLEVVDRDEPYFLLSASADYHIIAQMCERAGDSESAGQFEQLSKDRGMTALKALHDLMPEREKFEDCVGRMQVRRRIALRLGLLELYGDYTRFEMMLCEPPYCDTDHLKIARLNFEMGEYCRVVGKHESAVEYYGNVREHMFDRSGNPYCELKDGNIYEFSLIASASCLVKCGRMAQARRIFREFADTQKSGDGIIETTRLIKIAGLSRDIDLNPAECAGYLHRAAAAVENSGKELTVAAELYNQEGICWYNATPAMDSDDPERSPQANDRLAEKFADSEIEAFRNALRLLEGCDENNEKAIDLKPSLHSNIGECLMRKEDYPAALEHYNGAVSAFETLFASDRFIQKPKNEQEPYVFQYGLCFKSLGDIYNELEDNPKCAEALSKAIEIMERLDGDEARNLLGACLNARGVVYYRMGDYAKNVEDATRAINLKKDDSGGEINMAIMLKNRSDAYRELGDFKSMQSDLTQSIDLLGKSELPDELLNSFYGSNWFSMGVCQEGLHKIGKAADAYRKAAGYMDKSGPGEDSGAYMKALCHFRRAMCLCRREEQEYYGALYEYNNAIKLLEGMPASREKDENLSQLFSSRGSLYEAFREIDLAREDFSRAESLRSPPETQSES